MLHTVIKLSWADIERLTWRVCEMSDERKKENRHMLESTHAQTRMGKFYAMSMRLQGNG